MDFEIAEQNLSIPDPSLKQKPHRVVYPQGCVCAPPPPPPLFRKPTWPTKGTRCRPLWPDRMICRFWVLVSVGLEHLQTNKMREFIWVGGCKGHPGAFLEKKEIKNRSTQLGGKKTGGTVALEPPYKWDPFEGGEGW